MSQRLGGAFLGGFGRAPAIFRHEVQRHPGIESQLLGAIDAVAAEMPVIFPVHPHPTAFDAKWYPTPPQLRLIPPVGSQDFLCFLGKARLVLTDSGGLQEETTARGVRCLRLPREHGAPITIFQGTNLLVGTDPGKIVAARDTLAGLGKVGRIPPLWDGHTARRIVDILLKEVPRGHAS